MGWVLGFGFCGCGDFGDFDFVGLRLGGCVRGFVDCYLFLCGGWFVLVLLFVWFLGVGGFAVCWVCFVFYLLVGGFLLVSLGLCLSLFVLCDCWV